jgi:hypothetical protein
MTITFWSCENDEKENPYDDVIFDGVYSGTTDNESTIKFTISNNKVIELKVGSMNFGGSGYDVINGKFELLVFEHSIIGRYNGEEFEGDIDIDRELDDFGETWTAKKIYK